MKPSVVHYVGVDVAKHEIVIAAPTLGLRQSLPNTKTALLRWVQKMRNRPESLHVVCEATGGYERGLMEALWSEGLAVSRLNPRTVRHFAKARGLLAKTDAIDAVVLADFGAAFRPPSTPAPLQGATPGLGSLALAGVIRGFLR